MNFFVDKLLAIDVSLNTRVRESLAIRDEIKSIDDLAYLSIIEETYTRPASQSWAAAAKLHSEYLSSNKSVAQRDNVRDWVSQTRNTRFGELPEDADVARGVDTDEQPRHVSSSPSGSNRRFQPPISAEEQAITQSSSSSSKFGRMLILLSYAIAPIPSLPYLLSGESAARKLRVGTAVGARFIHHSFVNGALSPASDFEQLPHCA